MNYIMGYFILEILCHDPTNLREDYYVCQTSDDLKRNLYHDLITPIGMRTVICTDSELNLYVMTKKNKVKDVIELHPFITYKFEGLPQIRFNSLRQIVLFEGFKFYEDMLLNRPYPKHPGMTDQNIIIDITNMFLDSMIEKKMVKAGPDRWSCEYTLEQIIGLDLRYKGNTILVKGSVNWNLLMKKIPKINKKQPKSYKLNDYHFPVGHTSMI